MKRISSEFKLLNNYNLLGLFSSGQLFKSMMLLFLIVIYLKTLNKRILNKIFYFKNFILFKIT